MINDSWLAWIIFRFDSYECTYLNNLLVRNSDEVSHDYFKWVIEIAYAIEFYSSWNFTKRSRYFGFYWKDNLENAYAQVWLMWYCIYDMTQFFCEIFSNSVIFLLIFNDVMISLSRHLFRWNYRNFIYFLLQEALCSSKKTWK